MTWRAIPASEAVWALPAGLLRFGTTAELPPGREAHGPFLGQEALRATIGQAVRLSDGCHHVYVAAPRDVEATDLAMQAIGELRPRRRSPGRDLVCVQDPDDPERPRILALGPGAGERFREAMAELAARLLREVPRILDDPDLETWRASSRADLERNRAVALAQASLAVAEEGLAWEPEVQDDDTPVVLRLPEGGTLSRAEVEWRAARNSGPLPAPATDLLPAFDAAEAEVRKARARVRTHAFEVAEAAARLERQRVEEGIRPLFQAVARGFRVASPWLRRLQVHVADRFWLLVEPPEGQSPSSLPPGLRALLAGRRWRPGVEDDTPALLSLFQVHVLHRGVRGRAAPIVRLDRPEWLDLMGGVVSEGRDGRRADARDIVGGAVLSAHGGFLLLEAEPLLARPGLWTGLKTLLHRGLLEIRNPEVTTPQVLRPEAVPVDVQVVLVGTSGLHDWLWETDADFRRLFPMKAEVEDALPLDPEGAERFASFVADRLRSGALPPATREAVGALIRWGLRRSERTGRVSVRGRLIGGVLREAAALAGDGILTRERVEEALARRDAWHALARQRMEEAIEERRIVVALDGSVPGQANGIALFRSGPVTFGRPMRITATVGTGRGGVVNIEREAGLSGRIHDKGMQILAGLLRARFGRSRTLALTASLCFEQSYDRIDGDSASCAEALALLSALGDVPLRQDRAVTGSLDQHGRLQAIGGVNEKIEAFHAACTEAGLTGAQGVVLPAANVPDLNLSDAVAVDLEAGRFHLWSAETLDDALHLLTGLEAGTPRADGTFPEGTVYRAVAEALDTLQEVVRLAGRPAGRADDRRSDPDDAG